MWDDPIVAETRSLRDQIAARFAYDVVAIGEYFKARQAADAKKLIAQTVQSAQQTQPNSCEYVVVATNDRV